MAALGFDVAATLIQKRVRGRRTRQRYLLQQLAFLVQSHYRDPHARIDAVDLACALGAVRRLEGRLWKRSSQFPKYQERQVWVDDLQLKYSVRSGDPKTIDLAQIDQIVIHSEDRREFALCTRNGRSYTFRRKRQQASEALDSARAKAGTVLNFIPAFSYFSTEAITSIVICVCWRRPLQGDTPTDVILIYVMAVLFLTTNNYVCGRSTASSDDTDSALSAAM